MAANHPIAGAPSKNIFIPACNMVWLFMMAFIALTGVGTPAQAREAQKIAEDQLLVEPLRRRHRARHSPDLLAVVLV